MMHLPTDHACCHGQAEAAECQCRSGEKCSSECSGVGECSCEGGGCCDEVGETEGECCGGTDLEIGVDYIGVGVGALIFNDDGKFLMALRGPQARNERNTWEIPGGKVEFGERLADALKREIKEEIGVEIEVGELLHVADHLILDEQQHWVSPTFICRIVKGIPTVQEPQKCTKIEWFTLAEAKKMPLSDITKSDIEVLEKRKAK